MSIFTCISKCVYKHVKKCVYIKNRPITIKIEKSYYQRTNVFLCNFFNCNIDNYMYWAYEQLKPQKEIMKL